MFSGHYHHRMQGDIARMFRKRDVADLKTDLWNEFVDSGLIGINDDDCSALPNILPLSYLSTIKRVSRDITEFVMKLLSLPERELKAILLPSPVTDYLIDELGVLKHRQKRITGSLRFDMAIVGAPVPANPPKLLEVNEIGFDGTGRSSYIQETLSRIFPALKKRLKCLDTAASEVRNMRRLGRRMVRFQYDSYNWEEEVLIMKAKRAGLDLRLVQPSAFKVDMLDDCPLLSRHRISFPDGRLCIGRDKKLPSAFELSYSFNLNDYKEAPSFFRNLVRSKTPQYSPFVTGLIAPKTILILLNDLSLRRLMLGSSRAESLAPSILHAKLLSDNEDELRRLCTSYVLKHADGMGGEMVYVGKEILKIMKRIRKKDHKHWVTHDRVKLGTMDVDGFLSRRRKVIADLGVYVHYDWNGNSFDHFSVGGFITRATNRSFKVNVSGGGIQVPVMFDRHL
ncbi:MAG: hypothetical protein ABH871_08390 [Pseudomonadota bacterium]